MKCFIYIFAFIIHLACAVSSKNGPFLGCETEAFPPNRSAAVPQYTINLDLPPEQRWTQLIKEKRVPMVALIEDVRNLTQSLFGMRIFNIIMDNLGSVYDSLPSPYREEIGGIAEASGLLKEEVTLYNIFYEVFTYCTSIIVQDTSGKLYHGRNLDFGLFMGWDRHEHKWRVAELLKPLVAQVNWTKGGKNLYQSINYAGYVGIITAVKKGHFTFSLDERFGLNGGYMGLLEWILFHDHNQKWVTFLTREVMEEAKNYDDALLRLSHTRLLAPVYFILGGTKPGEATIITRWRDNFHTDDIGSSKFPWYLVETNYDTWESPPFFDDRRTPAIHCLREGQQYNASMRLLYNVLSTRPVFNKLTTYTSLMEVNDGKLGAWLRDCEDPCWPW